MTVFARKTLARMRTEMRLHVLAHGLKCVARIAGIGEMMRVTNARATQARISLANWRPRPHTLHRPPSRLLRATGR